jgi:hypothetical protein
MPEPKKGETRGRTRMTAIPGTRVYYKPSLRKIVFRPTNVIRSSDKVIEINKRLLALKGTTEHPAKVCATRLRAEGKTGWENFIKCLSEEMKKVITPVKTK